MEFQLTRKYLQGEIDASKGALQKHREGVRIHELVIQAFEEELKKLPEEIIEEPISIPSGVA